MLSTISLQDHIEPTLQQALDLFHQNSFQESLQVYHEVYKTDPTNMKAILGMIGNYIMLKRHIDALELIQEGLKIDRHGYQLRLLQLRSLTSLYRLEAAKILLDELKQEFPDKIEVLQEQERYLLECHSYKESKIVSMELMKRLPQQPSPCNNLGLAYLEEGAFAQSITTLRAGLKLVLNLPLKNSQVTTRFADQTKAKHTLLAIKQALDELHIPFMLIAGTILGIYRDGDILPHDKDIDLALPFKTPRLELIQTLKKHGFVSTYSEELITGLKGQYNISVHHVQYGISIDFFFAEPKDNGWIVAIEKGGSLLCCHHKARGTQTIRYADQDFTTIGDIEGYLEETYGKDWRKPKPNYNTLILGNNVVDPKGIGIVLCYNHCLGAICNQDYKKAHGYCLQLLSVHHDPLLEQVAQHLETYITNVKWYKPIPYRSKRSNNQILFGIE